MNIGILQTGHNNPALPLTLRSYPKMFQDLMTAQDGSDELLLKNYPVVDGIFPNAPDDHDGYIITGSRHGVYEPHDFIAPLKSFIQACFARHIPQIGICFGHQIIAEALGGKVIKSPKGWGVGIRKVNVVKTANWMANAPHTIDLIYFHQDQVIDLPDGAEIVAGDDFCPFAGFAIDDRIFTLQGHPEFDEGYVHELLAIRGSDMDDTVRQTASDSLSLGHDGLLAGEWMLRFLKNANQKDKQHKREIA